MAQPAANPMMLTDMRRKRARIAAWSPRPITRSTASSTAWVVLPVIKVVGGRWGRCTRCTPFCSAMAAMPQNPVNNAGSASLSGNGPSVTASKKKAMRNSTFRGQHDPQRRQAAGGQRRSRQMGDRDHGHELGKCNQLGDDALGAENERGAQGDEIAGDVCSEKTLQPDDPG